MTERVTQLINTNLIMPHGKVIMLALGQPVTLLPGIHLIAHMDRSTNAPQFHNEYDWEITLTTVGYNKTHTAALGPGQQLRLSGIKRLIIPFAINYDQPIRRVIDVGLKIVDLTTVSDTFLHELDLQRQQKGA